MALTVTTELVRITDAETVTGWSTYGSGGAGALALEPDFFVQNANCISRGVSGAVIKGMTFDIGAGATLNFSTTHAGKLVYIWMRTSTPGLCETRINGGIRIVLGSGATAPADAAGAWSAWYVDGSDTVAATDGWKCYVISPSLTASTTFGGGVDLTAVRWFGGVQRSTGTLKGQNFGIDAIYYGFGELRVRGTNTTVGSGFKEISDADYGTITNRYGVMTIKEGIFFIQGRIVLGDNVSTNATDFTSQDEIIVYNYPTYYDGTRIRACIPDARPDGTTYLGITRVGNATNDTNVAIGVKVGTGDTASGRSGGSFTGSRIRTDFLGQSGTVKATSYLRVYGAQFSKFNGGINLTSNVGTDEWLGGSIIKSGTLQSGPVTVRNTNFINGLGGAYTFSDDFINSTAASGALATIDPRIDWANAVGGTQLTVPLSTEYAILGIAAAVRNVVKINSDQVGSDDHYAEAIIRFPAGSNQGTIGIFFRASSTLATENYWFVQLNRPSNQISLIRCDAGVDTTVDGPDSVTLSADTDYVVQIRGSGTTIEAFVNGNKLTATSATYQTNRWVGIRGTTNNSQTASAEPRVYRFGCGPITNPFGAIRFSNSTDADMLNCNYINNARALDINSTGTYAFSGCNFSNNTVGVRNSSGGSVTINVTGDSPESVYENTGAGSLTVNNTVTYTLSNLQTGSEVRIYRTSDGVELAGVETSTTSFDYSYTYASDVPIHVHISNLAYEWLAINDTLGSSSSTTKVFQRVDRNYLNS